jgi:hypothetical protein
MPSNVLPFTTDDEVLAFAKMFLAGRIKGFRKDIRICLQRDRTGKHAYLPALMTCISFLDLLSGLHCGKLEYNGDTAFIAFGAAFLDSAQYNPDELAVLYHGFRHKIAHLGHPYAVFDTAKRLHAFQGARRRISWTIYASRRERPIKPPKAAKRQTSR